MKRLCLILAFLGVLNYSGQSIDRRNTKPVKHSQIADCFAINVIGVDIKASSCGTKEGSILGIVIEGEGKFSYAWKDELGRVVGNNLDLKNVPSGKYGLEVKATGDCPAQTISLTIDETNGISSDLSTVKVLAADCNNKGSVLGVKVTGASRLEWRSFSSGSIVSNKADLIDMPVGLYKLTAYNETGCIKDVGTFSVSSQTVMPIIEKLEVEDLSCRQLLANVQITLTILQDQETLSYYVFDKDDLQVLDGIISYNKNVSSTVLKFQLGPGDYKVFVRGKSGCNILLTPFKISESELSLAGDSIGVYNDQCNQHTGRILGIQIKGTTKPPKGRVIQWTDEKGKVVGGNFPFLLNIGAGVYTMHFTDPGGCELLARFTVKNESPDLIPPRLNDIDICLPGNISLQVVNVDTAGSYRLYDNPSEGASTLSESKNGTFNIPVSKTTNYYVSYLQGICESERTPVTVNVAAPGVRIPNTFTPNGDGVNDIWNIKELNNYPGTVIKVFNRYGNIVYSSVNYSHPFDGTRDGKELPAGVYFYKIDIKRISCEGKIHGSLTIMR